MKATTTVSLAGAAVLLLSLIAVPLAANAHSPGSDHTDLRDHCQRSGCFVNTNPTIEVSNNAASMPGGWDNRVSSLWVWSDVDFITLYEHPSYAGLSTSFVYGTDHLGQYGFNDMTSSYTTSW